MSADEIFMRLALEEAKKAFEVGEVPVGAVLVHQGQPIARAHNRVESMQDGSAHAEMLCLKEGARVLGNWRLLETTLYCTLEPCAMCGGAMLLSRIRALVWGAPDLRQGANGSWIDLFAKPHPIHQFSIRKGVLEAEASELMREFFRKRRGEDAVGKFI